MTTSFIRATAAGDTLRSATGSVDSWPKRGPCGPKKLLETPRAVLDDDVARSCGVVVGAKKAEPVTDKREKMSRAGFMVVW